MGAEYTGETDLLEYTVGDIAIDNLSNDTENDYGQVMVSGQCHLSSSWSLTIVYLIFKLFLFQVKIVFRRKWFYHLITIFIQSILLLCVAYMTFYFRINNFQVQYKIIMGRNGVTLV